MNICTILSENWLESHGMRWARYARKSNPAATLHLLTTGSVDAYRHVYGMFDRVVHFPRSCEVREWYNEVRMEATDLLGVDEVLYCDADADILRDLSWVPDFAKSDLMWVRSPTVSQEFREICAARGWKDWGANNGLLYLRKNLKAPYRERMEVMKKEGVTERLRGTYAFNWLVRDIESAELPYYTSVIWWDYANLCNAHVVQYCNDQGQNKRLQLELTWREACV